MSKYDIIVIGASAGGVEALKNLVGSLPGTLPATIFVVLHIPPENNSLLPAILTHAGSLVASHPEDGEQPLLGHIYVAPPDHHLLLEQGGMRVVRGPKENRHRPAVDPLFRSVAQAYGERVIGVILTGALDDGTAGLLAIKRQGGLAIVQDPQEALYRGMPQSALEHVAIDFCASLAEIGQLLPRLAREPIKPVSQPIMPDDLEKEVRIAAMETNATSNHEQVGQPSAFSCPECGGVLWEIQDGTLVRFRCRTGHAFTSESVLAEQSDALERALWFALKTLDERASLSRIMAQRAREHQREWLAQSFEQRTQEAEHHATSLRAILEHTPHQPHPSEPAGERSEPHLPPKLDSD